VTLEARYIPKKEQVQSTSGFKIVVGSFAVHHVIELYVLEELRDGNSSLPRTDGEATSNVSFANREKFLSVGLPTTSRGSRIARPLR
jgi:hypothetical protein